jgi:hypothetical protein
MNLFSHAPKLPTTIVKIDINTEEEPKFPAEKLKALFGKPLFKNVGKSLINNFFSLPFSASLILLITFFIAACSISIIHEKMPDRTIYKPLPDIFTDNIMAFPRALDVSDVLLAIGYNLTNILLVFHKHR